jgi:triosephosphate isomerase
MTNKYMYFIANWKMFGGLSTLNSLTKVIKFLKIFKKSKNTKIIYCPPNTLIRPMFKKVMNSKIQVGAQNCHESLTYGASTGSINSMMLKNVGAKYVIIGHSENRESGETDKLINTKIKAATKSGLKVIFCVGETLGQKRKKITNKILLKQITLGLQKVKKRKNIIIAYEPVWSIGTGVIPKSDDLFRTINFIKKKVKNIKVLYGGSVNPKNINELKLIKSIDGFLIGGASQDPKKFIDIIKKTYN